MGRVVCRFGVAGFGWLMVQAGLGAGISPAEAGKRRCRASAASAGTPACGEVAGLPVRGVSYETA